MNQDIMTWSICMSGSFCSSAKTSHKYFSQITLTLSSAHASINFDENTFALHARNWVQVPNDTSFRKKAMRPNFTEKARMCTGDTSFYKIDQTGKQASTQGEK
jgi:hypothetical protein